MSKTGSDFEHAVRMLFQSVPTLSIQDIQYIIDPEAPDTQIPVELDEGYQSGLFSFLLSQQYQKELGILEQVGNWHFYQGQEPLPMTLWLDALNPTTNVSLALETSSTSPLGYWWRETQASDLLLLVEAQVEKEMRVGTPQSRNKPTYGTFQQALATVSLHQEKGILISEKVISLVRFIQVLWQNVPIHLVENDFRDDIHSSLSMLSKAALLSTVDQGESLRQIFVKSWLEKAESMYCQAEAYAKALELI
jgi:hypothetical protein